ncbi:MAG: putative metal-binding motif-containing protein [Deltaproteobacteria bacterium]|nr:putative metal-binding motif-containing protein [Deltaproteobacteria bacterium]
MRFVRSRTSTAVFTGLCALLLVACGNGGVTDSGTDPKKDNGKTDIPTVIPEWPDIPVEIPDIINDDPGPCLECDIPPEKGPEVDGDITDPCVEEPGLPGCPCKENVDCDSGFCIETFDDKECAAFCTTEACPSGYNCVEVPGPEPIYICKFLHPRLCKPCKENADCRDDISPDSTEVCVSNDPEGRFCGSPCDLDKDCPEGYGCQNVTSAASSQVMQCVPDSGECTCSKKSIADSVATICFSENEFGSCPGERQCLESGLTDCDAKTPEEEVCDGEDNDCNDFTDDTVAHVCLIKNGWGECPGMSQCDNGKEICVGTPPAQELCNASDDDCDGDTDEQDAADCTVYYRDDDLDTYGVTTDTRCLCAPEAPHSALIGGDCDDANELVHGGIAETCNLKDDDCDGETDEEDAGGCTLFFLDNDRDDFGITADSKCLCGGVGFYTAVEGGDCDDDNDLIFPGAEEFCNEKDDDCNGLTDPEGSPGCANYYVDGDGDDYGNTTGQVRCLCAPDPPTKFTALVAGDCDDGDAGVNPQATEVCDQLDNDCDDATDEAGAIGCLIRFKDEDKDLYGSEDNICACVVSFPYTAIETGDCDDGDDFVNPGVPEACGDGKDNDCNGLTDEEGAPQCVDFYYDFDGDGWGTELKKCLCTADGFYRAPLKTGDCQDDNLDVHPGVPEACGNDVDDDCNGQTEEANGTGCTWFFYDYDLDGYGSTLKKCLCALTGLYTAVEGGDCLDNDGEVNPGKPELCNNSKDDDCSGGENEEGAFDCGTYYFDGDFDDYGDDAKATRCLCNPDPLTKHTAIQGSDCNDGDSQVSPGTVETCDQKDNDCDSDTDEAGSLNCQDYYYDFDQDQHGVVDPPALCLCGPDTGIKFSTLVADDCNDNDAQMAPGLLEVCDDKDNDCNGVTDDEDAQDCTSYYYDWDKDGYGLTVNEVCLCEPDDATWYTALLNDDCDDQDGTIHPGASVCGKDGDCDGQLLDPLEECDDGNGLLWDGCTACVVSEIRINETTIGEQAAPGIANLGNGEYAAAYYVNFTSPQDRERDVAFRLLSSGGLPKESPGETFVNTYTLNNQQSPEIAAYGNGKFVVVFESWQASGYDTDGWGIYGRAYDMDLENGGASPGFASAQEFIVNTYTTSWQTNPDVTGLPNGTLAVAWQSYGQDGDAEGVLARRLTDAGLPIGMEFQVNNSTTGSQIAPAIASQSDNRFMVVWQADGGAVGFKNIMLRMFEANGTPVADESMVNANPDGMYQYPDVSVYGDDKFVVAWDFVQGSDVDLYARRFNSNGTPNGTEFKLNSHTPSEQFGTKVGAMADGRMVVTWSSSGQDGSGMGIFARRYGSNGSPLAAEFQVNEYYTGDQTTPAVATQDDGSFVVLWQSQSQDASGLGVFGRNFTWD